MVVKASRRNFWICIVLSNVNSGGDDDDDCIVVIDSAGNITKSNITNGIKIKIDLEYNRQDSLKKFLWTYFIPYNISETNCGLTDDGNNNRGE
mmetsp:Transcript_24490/g.27410  ORF Transcript_24490/g.27410 Transcript_24490/m.27410 type:complete len:93 (+) Transcript_24490:461-739(+)